MLNFNLHEFNLILIGLDLNSCKLFTSTQVNFFTLEYSISIDVLFRAE